MQELTPKQFADKYFEENNITKKQREQVAMTKRMQTRRKIDEWFFNNVECKK